MSSITHRPNSHSQDYNAHTTVDSAHNGFGNDSNPPHARMINTSQPASPCVTISTSANFTPFHGYHHHNQASNISPSYTATTVAGSSTGFGPGSVRSILPSRRASPTFSSGVTTGRHRRTGPADGDEEEQVFYPRLITRFMSLEQDDEDEMERRRSGKRTRKPASITHSSKINLKKRLANALSGVDVVKNMSLGRPVRYTSSGKRGMRPNKHQSKSVRNLSAQGFRGSHSDSQDSNSSNVFYLLGSNAPKGAKLTTLPPNRGGMNSSDHRNNAQSNGRDNYITRKDESHQDDSDNDSSLSDENGHESEPECDLQERASHQKEQHRQYSLYTTQRDVHDNQVQAPRNCSLDNPVSKPLPSTSLGQSMEPSGEDTSRRAGSPSVLSQLQNEMDQLYATNSVIDAQKEKEKHFAIMQSKLSEPEKLFPVNSRKDRDADADVDMAADADVEADEDEDEDSSYVLHHVVGMPNDSSRAQRGQLMASSLMFDDRTGPAERTSAILRTNHGSNHQMLPDDYPEHFDNQKLVHSVFAISTTEELKTSSSSSSSSSRSPSSGLASSASPASSSSLLSLSPGDSMLSFTPPPEPAKPTQSNSHFLFCVAPSSSNRRSSSAQDASFVRSCVPTKSFITDITYISPSQAIVAMGDGEVELYRIDPSTGAIEYLDEGKWLSGDEGGCSLEHKADSSYYLHTPSILQMSAHTLDPTLVAAAGTDRSISIRQVSLGLSSDVAMHPYYSYVFPDINTSVTSLAWSRFQPNVLNVCTAQDDAGEHQQEEGEEEDGSANADASASTVFSPSSSTLYRYDTRIGLGHNKHVFGYYMPNIRMLCVEQFTDMQALVGGEGGEILQVDFRRGVSSVSGSSLSSTSSSVSSLSSVSSSSLVNMTLDPFCEAIGSIEYCPEAGAFVTSGMTDYTVWKQDLLNPNTLGAAQPAFHSLSEVGKGCGLQRGRVSRRVNESNFNIAASFLDAQTLFTTSSTGMVSTVKFDLSKMRLG